MTVTPHAAEDRRVLHERMTREPNAKQRDRYRAVLLAMDGLEGDEIAERVGRSPRFVDEWAGRYRRGGVEALVPKRQPGRPPKLTPDQEAALRARLDAGPRDTDGVCTLRGRDVCRIVAPGVRRRAHAGRDLRRVAPAGLLVAGPAAASPQARPGGDATVRRTRRPPFARALNDTHPGKRLRWFVQDEARVGQHGTLTRVWARTGSRPTAVRQTGTSGSTCGPRSSRPRAPRSR